MLNIVHMVNGFMFCRADTRDSDVPTGTVSLPPHQSASLVLRLKRRAVLGQILIDSAVAHLVIALFVDWYATTLRIG